MEAMEKLQQIEQSLQHVMIQKQSVEGEISEIDTALEHVDKSPDVYKNVGNIMIKQTSQQISKDLSDRKELLSTRLNSLAKQEERMQEKKNQVQQELLKDMKGDQNE